MQIYKCERFKKYVLHSVFLQSEFVFYNIKQKFEVRRYEPSKWIAVTKVAMLYTEKDRNEMFFKLFHYISGNNTHSKSGIVFVC